MGLNLGATPSPRFRSIGLLGQFLLMTRQVIFRVRYNICDYSPEPSILAAAQKRREVFYLCVLLACLAASIIWVRTATVKATYLYVAREKELKLIEIDAQEARLRWLKMTTPRRLENLAGSLGLQAPNLQQIQKMSKERAHGNP
jgi:hypothetical protein